MPRAVRRLAVVPTLAIAVVVSVGVLAPTATAGAPHVVLAAGGHVTGPDPIEAEPIDTAAGEACAFPVHVRPALDREFVYSYYDGSGRLTDQLFYGTLVDQLVNTDTGASTLADISGTALYSYGVDGSLTIYGVGPYLAVFRAGDTPGPSIRRIDGASKLVIAADGSKELVYAASSENLCDRID